MLPWRLFVHRPLTAGTCGIIFKKQGVSRMSNLRITIATLTLICCMGYMSPFLAYALGIEEAPLGYLWSLVYAMIGIVIMDGRVMVKNGMGKLVYGICLAMHLISLLLMMNQWSVAVDRKELLAVYLAVHFAAAVLLFIYIAKIIIHKSGGTKNHAR